MFRRFLLKRLVQYLTHSSVEKTDPSIRPTRNYFFDKTNLPIIREKKIPVRGLSIFHSDNMTSPLLIERHNEMRLKAHKICSDHLGGAWSKISTAELLIRPVTGGMTNLLFCCSLPQSTVLTNGEPTQVLLRFYGDQWRNCDMSAQLDVFNLLSSKDLGPKLYGSFEDGRIEEFLPAVSLSCHELTNREISMIIAKKIASVHNLDVSMAKKNTWLLSQINSWLSTIKELGEIPNLNEATRGSTIAIARELLAVDFDQEIKFLTGLIEKTRSPIVFSHNDLHQGNILLSESTKRRKALDDRIVLIDFEYCSYNYRGYDIANHFCEWCFEYDTPEYPHFLFFEDRFPSKENQRDFVRSYLRQKKKLDIEKRKQNIVTSSVDGNHHLKTNQRDNSRSISTNGHHTNGHSKPLVSEAEEVAMLNEVRPFLMAANLLWTLWCVKSAQATNLKFGYWEHAMARWRFYIKFKTAYLKDQRMPANGHRLSASEKSESKPGVAIQLNP